MKTTIIGKQMNVSEDLKELVTKKLSKFDKFFREGSEAFVTFNRRHGEECLEVTISANGTLFRAEKKSETFRNALDECIESIERQIRKNKTRLEKRLREGAFEPTDGSEPVPEVDSSSGDTCVVYRRDDGNYGLIIPEK